MYQNIGGIRPTMNPNQFRFFVSMMTTIKEILLASRSRTRSTSTSKKRTLQKRQSGILSRKRKRSTRASSRPIVQAMLLEAQLALLALQTLGQVQTTIVQPHGVRFASSFSKCKSNELHWAMVAWWHSHFSCLTIPYNII